MSHNEVMANDFRYFPYKKPHEFHFLSLTQGPGLTFKGKGFANSYKAYDKKTKKYTDMSEEIMFSTYFFLSDDFIEHKRNLKHIFGVLAEFGGLASAILTFGTLLGINVNQKLFMGKIITKIFSFKGFGESSKVNEPNDESLREIEFSLIEKFGHAKITLFKVLCCLSKQKVS